MKIIEPKLSKNAKIIAEKRYLKTDLSGKVIETPGEMFYRVAKYLAKAEIHWGDANDVEKYTQEFYQQMTSFKFVVAGKAMFEAGNQGGTGQLSSCFVLPIVDDMREIFRTLGNAALVHKNNGGTGFNFSKIRPRGDRVRNVPNAASGPIDFITAFSAALSKILQGSKRQGANIAVLNVDHPDIVEFITLKKNDGNIKNFNISVGITDKFMQAVEKDGDWQLKNPRNGEVWQTVKARTLFDLIGKNAWQSGDPGLAFLDRMQADNPVPQIGTIDATNPCGEIPLLPYESCNLTSIVLSNHLRLNNQKNSLEIDWESLEKSIFLAVRLLDNMIEVNSYPIAEIKNMVKNGNRRIGLGVMGFAHLLYKLKISYASYEAVRLSERLSKFIRTKAEQASLSLAKQRGVFPNWDLSIYAGSAEKYRNCALTMIAPTGTTSILANVSSGIEPVFSLVSKRRTFYEDDKNNHSTKELLVIDPVFRKYLDKNIASKKRRNQILQQIAETNSLENIPEISESDRKVFITTHHIQPKWHVKIQAAWQKYFDNSVSKTINFPHDATVDQVKEAYFMAWKLGCKGITIYRDGSKQDQVLNLASKAKQTKNGKIFTKVQKSEIKVDSKTQNEHIKISESKLTVSKDSNSKKIKSKQLANNIIKNTSQQDNLCPNCSQPLAINNESLQVCYNCGFTYSIFDQVQN